VTYNKDSLIDEGYAGNLSEELTEVVVEEVWDIMSLLNKRN